MSGYSSTFLTAVDWIGIAGAILAIGVAIWTQGWIKMSGYSNAFLTAVDFVIKHEGGYENDPSDPGGETNFGISKRSFPSVDIKALTRDKAVDIYYNEYWIHANCSNLPPGIAVMHFDACVNSGIGAAARMLQRSVGVKIDGTIGAKTIGAVSSGSEKEIIDNYANNRILFYRGLRSFVRFGRGWIARVEDCKALSLSLIK